MSLFLIIVSEDINKINKITLNEPYIYNISLPEQKNKKICINENIKISVGSEKVSQEKIDNMEIVLETPKEKTYELENCYTIGPR